MTALAESAGGSYPIGELARQAGVSTRTVRYYEEIGLLSTPRRREGGRRVFDREAVSRLRFIGRLKTLGFSLEEIGELNEIFAVTQSTAEMLAVLETQLRGHLATIERRERELAATRKEIQGYLRHVQGRLKEMAQNGRRQPRRQK